MPYFYFEVIKSFLIRNFSVLNNLYLFFIISDSIVYHVDPNFPFEELFGRFVKNKF